MIKLTLNLFYGEILLYKNCVLPLFNSDQIGVTFTNSSTKIDINSTYLVDTKLGEVILILPPNPEPGDYITFLDVNNTWNKNMLILVNNTKKINGKVDNLAININNIILTMIYYGDDSYNGWTIVISDTSPA